MLLHLHFQKKNQTTVHCSCTYSCRKQIQSYYIKIQPTSNVHCSIIIWDIKIQNLQLNLHFQKANSDSCTHCNCTYTSRKKIQTVVHCSCTYTCRKQIQSYYIKIQATSNVHCSIIIWDIKIQNSDCCILQLHFHYIKIQN